MTVAVPYDYVTTTGLVVPDTSGTLATVLGWWTSAFGADLSVDPSTPQGTVISTEVMRVGIGVVSTERQFDYIELPSSRTFKNH